MPVCEVKKEQAQRENKIKDIKRKEGRKVKELVAVKAVTSPYNLFSVWAFASGTNSYNIHSPTAFLLFLA